MRKSSQPKIVVIGGGTGSSVALRGLKPYIDNLTSIVTMFDSGGSSGALSSEFGYPPLGDLRSCLLALAESNEMTEALRPLVEFRFERGSSLNGHSLGNLLMAALTSVHSDGQAAVDEMSRILHVRGQVLPVTLERANLCAELENGEFLRSESAIDLRGERHPRISRVFLDSAVDANPRAVEAIMAADAVVLGPGDLYTSVIPNLLANGIAQAIAETAATRIYVCNLMTKLGETDDFRASDFVCEITRYLGGPHLDWAIVNSQAVPAEIRTRYLAEEAQPVEIDQKRVHENISWFFGNELAQLSALKKMRHQADGLAKAIVDVAERGRPAMEPRLRPTLRPVPAPPARAPI